MSYSEELYNKIVAEPALTNESTYDEFLANIEDPEQLKNVYFKAKYFDPYNTPSTIEEFSELLKKKDEVDFGGLSQPSEQDTMPTEETTSQIPTVGTNLIDPNSPLKANISVPMAAVGVNKINNASINQEEQLGVEAQNQVKTAPQPEMQAPQFQDLNLIQKAKSVANNFKNTYLSPLAQADADVDRDMEEVEDEVNLDKRKPKKKATRGDVKNAANELLTTESKIDAVNRRTYEDAKTALGKLNVYGIKVDGDEYQMIYTHPDRATDIGVIYDGTVGDASWKGYVESRYQAGGIPSYNDDESWQDLKEAVVDIEGYDISNLRGDSNQNSLNVNLTSHKRKYGFEEGVGVSIPSLEIKRDKDEDGKNKQGFFRDKLERVLYTAKTQIQLTEKAKQEAKEFQTTKDIETATMYIPEAESNFFEDIYNNPTTNEVGKALEGIVTPAKLMFGADKDIIKDQIKYYLIENGQKDLSGESYSVGENYQPTMEEQLKGRFSLQQSVDMIYNNMVRDAQFHFGRAYIEREGLRGNQELGKKQTLEKLNYIQKNSLDTKTDRSDDPAELALMDFGIQIFDAAKNDYKSHYEAKADILTKTSQYNGTSGRINALNARILDISKEIEGLQSKYKLPSQEESKNIQARISDRKKKLDELAKERDALLVDVEGEYFKDEASSARGAEIEKEMQSLTVTENGQTFWKDEASQKRGEELQKELAGLVEKKKGKGYKDKDAEAKYNELESQMQTLIDEISQDDALFDPARKFSEEVNSKVEKARRLKAKMKGIASSSEELNTLKGLQDQLDAIDQYNSMGGRTELDGFSRRRKDVEYEQANLKREGENDNAVEAFTKGMFGGIASTALGFTLTAAYLNPATGFLTESEETFDSADMAKLAIGQMIKDVSQFQRNPYYKDWSLNSISAGVGGVVPDLIGVALTGGGSGIASLASKYGLRKAVGKIATSPTTLYFTMRSTGERALMYEKAGYSPAEALAFGAAVSHVEAMLESLIPEFGSSSQRIAIKSAFGEIVEQGIKNGVPVEEIAKQLTSSFFASAGKFGYKITEHGVQEGGEEGIQGLVGGTADALITGEDASLYNFSTGEITEKGNDLLFQTAVGGIVGPGMQSVQSYKDWVSSAPNRESVKLVQLTIGKDYKGIYDAVIKENKDLKDNEVLKHYEKISQTYNELSNNPTFKNSGDLEKSEILDRTLALDDLLKSQKELASKGIVDKNLDLDIEAKQKELSEILDVSASHTEQRKELNEKLKSLGVEGYSIGSDNTVNNIKVSPQIPQNQVESVVKQATEIIETTYKPKEDAVQKSEAGQVPVQPEAAVGQQVEEGTPQAEPQVTTKEGGQPKIEPHEMGEFDEKFLHVDNGTSLDEGYLKNNFYGSPIKHISGFFKSLFSDKKAAEKGVSAYIFKPKSAPKRTSETQLDYNTILSSIDNIIDMYQDGNGKHDERLINSAKKAGLTDEVINQIIEIKNSIPESADKKERYENSKKALAQAENVIGEFMVSQGVESSDIYRGAEEETRQEGDLPKQYRFFGSKGNTMLGAVDITPELAERLSDETLSEEERGRIISEAAGIEYDPDAFVHLNSTKVADYAKKNNVKLQGETKAEGQENVEEESLSDEEWNDMVSEAESLGSDIEQVSQNVKQDTRKSKIVQQIKKGAKSLSSIFPNMKIVVHENNASYNKAMDVLGGRKNTRGQFVYMPTADNNYTGAIHINLERANGRTVPHEIAHAVMLKLFGENAEVFKNFRDKIKDLAKGRTVKLKDAEGNVEEVSWDDLASDLADRYEDNERGEEYLAELTGIMNDIDLDDKESRNIFQKVADFINNFISRFTGLKAIDDTSSAEDVLEFFEGLSGKISRGESIKVTPLEKALNSEPYGEPIIIEVDPETFEAKPYKKSKSQIGDYKFPKNISILKTADTPIKTLNDVIREYGGRVVMITSDATGYGVDRNGDPILGGPGFAQNYVNVNDGIGFASLNVSTVKSTYTLAEKSYGEGKVVVLIMVQNPHTTINNSYGAKYIIRGLSEIRKSSESEFKKSLDSIITFIKKSKDLKTEINKINKSVDDLSESIDKEKVKLQESKKSKKDITSEIKQNKDNEKLLKKLEGKLDKINKKIIESEEKIEADSNKIKELSVKRSRGSLENLIKFFSSIKKDSDINALVDEYLLDTTFNSRKILGEGLVLQNPNTKVNKATTYSKIALNNLGYNIYDFLNEYGDNTILDEDMKLNNQGGFLVSGFELDILPSEERLNLINEIQAKGIKHPLFNAKLPGVKHFRLDALYPVNENFVQFAKPDKKINLPDEERDAIIREFYPNKKGYGELTAGQKIKIKNEYFGPAGLLIDADPDVSTKVAKGEGFVPKEGAISKMTKYKFSRKKGAKTKSQLSEDEIASMSKEEQSELLKDTPALNIDGQTIFYHGSDKPRKGRLKMGFAEGMGEGIYFATDKDAAQYSFGDNITEAALNPSNPVTDGTKEFQELKELATEKAGRDSYDFDEIDAEYITKAAKELGIDAIITSGQYGMEVVVLDESKIIYDDEIPSFISKSTKGPKTKSQLSDKVDTFFDEIEEIFPNDDIRGGYAVTNENGDYIGRVSMSAINDNTVKIDEVVSKDYGQKTGNGSAIMNMVTEVADNNGVTLKLMPNLILGIKAKGFETPDKLKAFYEKFGFVKDSKLATMTRQPKQSKGQRVKAQIDIDAKDSPLYKKRNKEDVNFISNERVEKAILNNQVRPDQVARYKKAKPLQEGEILGARLNLNGTKDAGFEIMSIHEGVKRGGKVNKVYKIGTVKTYRGNITLKNVVFQVVQSAREGILKKTRGKEPMALAEGEYTTKEANFDGIEVKFNPKKLHLFVDSEGRAIKSAEEVTIMGHRAYARGKISYYEEFEDPREAKYTAPSEVKFAKTKEELIGIAEDLRSGEIVPEDLGVTDVSPEELADNLDAVAETIEENKDVVETVKSIPNKKTKDDVETVMAKIIAANVKSRMDVGDKSQDEVMKLALIDYLKSEGAKGNLSEAADSMMRNYPTLMAKVSQEVVNQSKREKAKTRSEMTPEQKQLEATIKREAKAALEGYTQGKKEGKAEGVEKGKEAGRKEGFKEGQKEGKAEGKEMGRKEGIVAGRKVGFFEGIFRGAAKAESAQRNVAKAVRDVINEFKKTNKISDAVARQLVKRAVGITTENELADYMNFVSEVLMNNEIATALSEIKKLQKQALKKRTYQYYTTIRQFAKMPLFKDRNLLFDYETLEQYLDALRKIVDGKVPDISGMNSLHSSGTSLINFMNNVAQLNKKGFDIDKAQQVVKDIINDLYFKNIKINNVDDFRNFKRQVSRLRNNLGQLLAKGVITQTDYDNAMGKLVDLDATYTTYSEYYQDQIDAIKNQLIKDIFDGQIKDVVDFMNSNPDVFTDPQKELIRKLAGMNPQALSEVLDIEDADSLREVVESMEDGFVDEAALRRILSKAEIRGNKVGEKINAQLAGIRSRYKKGDVGLKLFRDLMTKAVVFWESQLGLSEKGAFWNYVSQPITRAINQWNKLYDESIRQFMSDVKGISFKGTTEVYDPVSQKYVKVSNETYSRIKIGLIGHILDNAWKKVNSPQTKEDMMGDWLGDILNNKAIAINFQKGGDYNMAVVMDIYKKLAGAYSNDNGGINHEALLAAYEKGGRSRDNILSKDEQSYYDALRRQFETTSEYVIAANSMRQQNSETNPYYMPRSYFADTRNKRVSSDVNKEVSGKAGQRASASYERVAGVPYEALEFNVDKLLNTHLEEVYRDYSLTEAKVFVNEVFANARDNAKTEDEVILLDQLQELAKGRIEFALEDSANLGMLSSVTKLFVTNTLIGVKRTPVEFLNNLIVYSTGNRSSKSVTLPFNKKELDETDELLKRFNSSIYADAPKRQIVLGKRVMEKLKSGKMDAKLKQEAAINLIYPYLNNTTSWMRKGEWKSNFDRAFQELTGEKFSFSKHYNDPKYNEAMSEAANAADFNMRRIMKGGNKSEQAQYVKLAPEWMYKMFGNRRKEKGMVSVNSYGSMFLTLYTGFIGHDVTNIEEGFRKTVTGKEIKDGLKQMGGAAFRLSLYPTLMVVADALLKAYFGDDDEKKEGEETLKSLTTPEGYSDLFKTLASQMASSYVSGKYGNLAKLVGSFALDAAYSYGDDNQKKMIKTIMRELYFTDPMDWKQSSQAAKDYIYRASSILAPMVGMIAKEVEETIEDLQDKSPYEKVTVGDIIEYFTKDEEGASAWQLFTGVLMLGQGLMSAAGTPIPFVDDFVRMFDDSVKNQEVNDRDMRVTFTTESGQLIDMNDLLLNDKGMVDFNISGLTTEQREELSELATEKYQEMLDNRFGTLTDEQKQNAKMNVPKFQSSFKSQYNTLQGFLDKAKFEAMKELGYNVQEYDVKEERYMDKPLTDYNAPSHKDDLIDDILKGKHLTSSQHRSEKADMDKYVQQEFEKYDKKDKLTPGGLNALREYYKAKYINEKYKLGKEPREYDYLKQSGDKIIERPEKVSDADIERLKEENKEYRENKE